MKTALLLPPEAGSLIRACGLPVLQRAVLSVLRNDFDRVVVIGGAQTTEVRALLRADVRTRGVEIRDTYPDLDGDEVTLVRSDAFVTPATIHQVATAALEDRPLVLVAGGEAQIVRCPISVWSSLGAAAVESGQVGELLGRLQALAAAELPLAVAVCHPVRDAATARRAELAYCERMRHDSRASDGPLAHWLDRRISLQLSRWIVAHTGLRPNHITLLGTTIGLIASALLGVGAYATGIAGTLLFLCATIIDGCDGEVARMKFLDSPFGQKLDVTTDNLVHVTIFLGLAAGMYRTDPDGPYLWLVSLLLGGFAFDGAVTYFFLVKRPGFASSGGTPRTWQGKLRQHILAAMEAMMNRDFAYILLLLALAGRLHWFVWGAAFGTWGFGILLILVYKWRDAA